MVNIYLAHVLVIGGLIILTKSIAHFSNAYRVNCGFKGMSSLQDVLPSL